MVRWVVGNLLDGPRSLSQKRAVGPLIFLRACMLGDIPVAWSPCLHLSGRLDKQWRFLLQGEGPPQCPSGVKWAIDLDNVQCFGLTEVFATDVNGCLNQCCAEAACETYQVCLRPLVGSVRKRGTCMCVVYLF